MPAKSSMLSWAKKSGMKKAEFLRVALMIGATQLANEIAKENLGLLAQQPART